MRHVTLALLVVFVVSVVALTNAQEKRSAAEILAEIKKLQVEYDEAEGTEAEVNYSYFKSGSVALLPPIRNMENHRSNTPPDELFIQELNKIRPAPVSIVRNVIGITKVLLADYIDPPRELPLIGLAQLHHVHYKGTVHYEETTKRGNVSNATEVLYLDLDHFHRVDADNAQESDGVIAVEIPVLPKSAVEFGLQESQSSLPRVVRLGQRIRNMRR